MLEHLQHNWWSGVNHTSIFEVTSLFVTLLLALSINMSSNKEKVEQDGILIFFRNSYTKLKGVDKEPEF